MPQYDKLALGVDIGGTSIKLGLVTEHGKIVKFKIVPTCADKSKRTIINNLLSSIGKLMRSNVIGIGLGFPGPANYNQGKIIKTPNLNKLNGMNLKSIVHDKFNIPVFCENDANCFALAEAIYGKGKNFDNVVGLTLGTGVGGGIVIKGRIYQGRGNAGELGHIIMDPEFNDFESKVSGTAITRTKLCEPINLFELARRRDKIALKIWKRIGVSIGTGIVTIMHCLDPDVIIIGGKISNAWDYFSKSMKDTIKEHCLFKPCFVVKKKLNEPGVIGAASLVYINSDKSL
ncbi:ROK family protein [Candidatus Woesearchaeota archaeon]|nr:ROK family protein [Candidatus Woesearchaeota archaeon]